mmetsp:Transcript_26155/g.76465  ORF Transcript_26155/g.76465 Transcript_26155/m.76465 type:complete len:139 (-) Transcript_26155:341-757(-)
MATASCTSRSSRAGCTCASPSPDSHQSAPPLRPLAAVCSALCSQIADGGKNQMLTAAAQDAEHRGKEAHIAEATAFCIDKHVINARSENEDMYASIDELTDTLTRSLRKYKEKRIDIKEERKRTSKETIGAEILEDDE